MEGNVEYEINKLKRQIDKMIKKNKFDDALHLMSCLIKHIQTANWKNFF